ncbi:MAG: DUF4198 domain-containing protein [Sulfurovum sp.]|nr:DUF4198 domain-containing protein [Sulfurovum sp.]
MKKLLITFIGSGYILSAHTLWIDGLFQVHEGHMHQQNLQEKKSVLKHGDISDVLCMKHQAIRVIRYNNASNAKCDALYIKRKPAYYTKTPYGTKKMPKSRVKMSIKSWRSIESVKRIYSKQPLQPFGKGLEIVLRNDPSKIEVGDKARLSIYYNGKPLKGATIANGHKTIGVSDDHGQVNVKIREHGLQNIKASWTTKGDGVKCDEVIHTTTLNFEVE